MSDAKKTTVVTPVTFEYDSNAICITPMGIQVIGIIILRHVDDVTHPAFISYLLHSHYLLHDELMHIHLSFYAYFMPRHFMPI